MRDGTVMAKQNINLCQQCLTRRINIIELTGCPLHIAEIFCWEDIMKPRTVVDFPVNMPSQQDIFGPYDACEAPQTEAVVVYCGDPRYRKAHKEFLRNGLKLGVVDEQYIQLPIPGGAALFAHPEALESYYEVLADCLETYCTHFDTVTRLILLGHFGCKHMMKVYQRLGIAQSGGGDRIRQDLATVARAFAAKSEASDCLISRLFAMFKVEVEVYYLRPSVRVRGKFDVERIRA